MNYLPFKCRFKNLIIRSCSKTKKLITKNINEDQTGYVKNRFIGFNLRQIQDIIDYADLYKIEGAIIFKNGNDEGQPETYQDAVTVAMSPNLKYILFYCRRKEPTPIYWINLR
jgi:hypothetical protein